MEMQLDTLKTILEEAYHTYALPNFVEADPISIPKSYHNLQDIEITAFWTSILSWGLRKTIINKANELFNAMDNSPHQFIVGHSPQELKKFVDFKHRTFNGTDALYFIDFFKRYYETNDSLEEAFILNGKLSAASLNNFKKTFFNGEYVPDRTRKHIASPETNASCKRIMMFLRWMVRSSKEGVDFGLWKKISAADLFIPLDVHVERTAMELGILSNNKRDWKAVVALTDVLKKLDPLDPIKYDFALFNISLNKG